MEKLTPEQVWNLVVYGTAAMLVMVFTIIGLVLFFNRKAREYDEELAALRAKLRKEKTAEDSEFIEISNGRKIKRRK